jgi:hypothetical protein
MVRRPDRRSRRSLVRALSMTLGAFAVANRLPAALNMPMPMLPGSLGILPVNALLPEARRLAGARLTTAAHETAVAYLSAHDADGPAVRRFDDAVRLDFSVGRVLAVHGWVVAETELALLALISRS